MNNETIQGHQPFDSNVSFNGKHVRVIESRALFEVWNGVDWQQIAAPFAGDAISRYIAQGGKVIQ